MGHRRTTVLWRNAEQDSLAVGATTYSCTVEDSGGRITVQPVRVGSIIAIEGMQHYLIARGIHPVNYPTIA